MTTTTFRLQRPSKLDLVFDGEKIAHETTRDFDDQPRWTEIRIYHTATGRFVTEEIGFSTVETESNKIKVVVCNTADDVRKALERTEQGRTFLRNIAHDAIAAAGEKYPELIEAVTERI